MKNYITTTVTKEEKEYISLTCDKCKKTSDDIMDTQEWFNIHFIGGYDSIFGDMDEYDLDLCQQCGKELFGQYLRHIADHMDFL